MRFSERYGYKRVRDAIQIDSMSDELRNALWSLLKIHVWDQVQHSHYLPAFVVNPDIKDFVGRLWFSYYKRPLDNIGGDWEDVYKRIRIDFYESEWYVVYDFIEFVTDNFPYQGKDAFVASCNFVLEREGSAYRLVDGLIARITEEEQVAEVELALEKAQGPVRTHLRRALELLSNKKNPDYRNSIKESISAVESLVATILGEKGTLGQLIKKMEEQIGLHPALRNAFSNLYGYTSDEEGIRHAILESETVLFEDAKFFLVVCSAFANYVNEKTPSLKKSNPRPPSHT